ncbi:MAG TPA: hypothetical protein VFY15_05460 [Acidimicrobiia bacterium]|nr:hypothetical protein [Acidimicrobiia bacterium]
MTIRAACAAALLLTACSAGPGTESAEPGSTATVEVLAGGIRWDIPPAACLAATDHDAIATAANDAAEELQDLVADRATGWPTTTRALPGEEAGFYAAINRAGPVALALAVLAGTVDAVVAGWDEFEAGYASLPDSPGPVRVISDRMAGWMTTANDIAAAVPGVCG